MAINNILSWNPVHQEVLLGNHFCCRGVIPYTLPYMCYDLLSTYWENSTINTLFSNAATIGTFVWFEQIIHMQKISFHSISTMRIRDAKNSNLLLNNE